MSSGKPPICKGGEVRVLMYLHHLPGVHYLRGQHCHGPQEGARGGAVATTWRPEEPPAFPRFRTFLPEVHLGLQIRRRTSHPPNIDQGEVYLGPGGRRGVPEP